MVRLQEHPRRPRHPAPSIAFLARLAAREVARVWGLDRDDRERLAERLRVYFHAHDFSTDGDGEVPTD
jgi:hypothetical protein